MQSRSPLFPSLRVAGLALLSALAVSADHSVAAGATQPTKSQPSTMRAAAVVNDIVISTYDLEQRVKLVMVTSGARDPDAVKRLRPQVLRQLVDELLELQEAQKLNVKITQEEFDKNFQRIAKQNNVTPDAINKMLDDNGVARSSLQTQLKADLAWQKLVQGRLAPRVSVSDEEVDQAYKQALAASSQTQYLVSEIFIAVDVPEAEDQAKQNIQTILNHVKTSGSFSAVARQFSQSASRTNGGDIGWVGEGDLPGPVAAAVKNMAPGAISDPIRAPGGYYLIGLRQKRLPAGSKVAVATAPTAPVQQAEQKMKSVLVLGHISMTLPANASKDKQEAARNAAIETYRSINGCQTAGAVAKAHGAKFEMIGQMSVKDMAPQFVQILQKTPNGRATPPLRGATGVEMFVICSGGMVPPAGAGGGEGEDTVTAAGAVDRDEIENRLFNQELSMLARRYLRDLRRDATIEIKDN